MQSNYTSAVKCATFSLEASSPHEDGTLVVIEMMPCTWLLCNRVATHVVTMLQGVEAHGYYATRL